MLKEEFLNMARLGDISPEDYQVIEYVYNWHPNIDNVNGKEEIATIYNIGGMRIIRDMLPTAEKAEELQNDITRYQRILNDLIREYDDLRGGRD